MIGTLLRGSLSVKFERVSSSGRGFASVLKPSWFGDACTPRNGSSCPVPTPKGYVVDHCAPLMRNVSFGAVMLSCACEIPEGTSGYSSGATGDRASSLQATANPNAARTTG